MIVIVNGEQLEVPAGTTVADTVHARIETDKGVAVAVDREVVPRSAWSTTELREGAKVEILAASSGG